MDIPPAWLEETIGQMSVVSSMPMLMEKTTSELFPHMKKDSKGCWTSGLAVKTLKETTNWPSPESSITLQEEQNPSGLFNQSEIMEYDIMEHMDLFDNISTANVYGEDDECLSSFLDLNDFLKEPSDSNKTKTSSENADDTSFTDFGVLLEKMATEFPNNENQDLLSLAVSDIFKADYNEGTPVNATEESVLSSLVSSVLELPSTVVTDGFANDHDYVKVKTEEKEEVTIKKRPSEDKYKERRIKNNIASKRSREIRKKKFVDMEGKAEELIKENTILREKISQLEILTKEMKAILIKKMVEK